ncbi:MAG: PIN domain-containing protein [Nanoarchaeota archaeon]|nr:PIN domain-containing protein [Nanoarchaeota archaeon]MBU1320723.1 PIN domain-containing protein [Nanoarchaeota archaeon]MBU1598272.1 PIN domain-containing protein [Nanoarchaeota archaeon]MBU2442160.1 PIN domain-containing protein [Nanoarchaeota archaeon]
MKKQAYYVDSCIWLNLFKKEGDFRKGKPYWKIAEEFIKKIMFSRNQEITYSGIVIKEIIFNVNKNLFEQNSYFFEKEPNIRFVKVTPEDKNFAREIESKFDYEISYYDCIHIALCKRFNMILVTRDKKLINLAKKIIKVKKPEQLLA